MKATCPSCSTSYKVADEKVPDAGAQIKCPKCNTLFVVRRPPTVQVPPPPAHEQSTPLQDLTGRPPPPPAPEAKPPPAEAEKPEPARKARGMSAIRAQSGVKLQDTFRVRTHKGLTYDFPAREAMIRWLRERDDLTGCEASAPGEEWRPAHELIEAAPLDGAEARPAGVALPPRPVPVPRPQPKPRPVSPEAGLVLWVAVGVSALLVVLVTAATLTRYGLVDLTPYLPLQAVGIQAPGQSSGKEAPGVPKGAEVRDPDKMFHKAISMARSSIRAKRFSKAALEYNRALSVRPSSAEALEGLAQAYIGLGDRGRAESVRKKARSIKGE
jgi:predicted Zn finger-like uncharacterized protein